MNTPQITQNTGNEQMVQNLNTERAIVAGQADKPEDTIIIHEAKIITPQPYGIYALCKIYEHFQIN